MTTVDDSVEERARLSATALERYGVLDTPAEAAFDDLAQLAATICNAPIALVSLVASDRQWFKAKVGFDATETPLDSSVCAHALAEPDLLVIPDLTSDPRTRGNPLVTGPSAIRFYAGAPLRDGAGVAFGSLCVIDTVPRPAGLTGAQADALRALAREVVALLDLRRLVDQRDQTIVAAMTENHRLRASEQQISANAAHWRGLFDGMREAFIVGQAVRDANGQLIDWRHIEANPAFEGVSGLPTDAVLGRTVGEVAPELASEWLPFMSDVLDGAHSRSFSDVPGRDGRRYEGRVFAIGDDQFAALFVDVTDRLAAECRQQALLEISDRLRDLDTEDAMSRDAGRIVCAALNGVRAGYGRLDNSRELVTVLPDWTEDGIVSVAGVHRFADYGNLLEELLAGEPLVLNDVRTDPRTAADPQPLLRLAVAAQVHMPIRQRGQTVAIVFIHSDVPRTWTADELLFLREVGDRVESALARIEVEHRRRLQNEELSHRLKNTLAMVQAIASQTLKPVGERAVVEVFERRLTALATAHDVLLGSAWQAAPLERVISSVMDAAGQDGRVTVDGPTVLLSPRAVLSVSLLFHELATNAVKYGALSVPGGSASALWRLDDAGDQPAVTLDWSETGGPPAIAPVRRGFGSRLINMGLAGTGGVRLSYDANGFSATMSAPLDDLTKT